MEVKCYINLHSFYDFARFHRFYSNKRAWNIVIFPIVILALSILNFILNNTAIGVILLLLAILQPPLVIFLFQRNTNAQIGKYRLNETPQHFYTVTFYSDHIYVKNSSEYTNYSWSQLYKVFETPHYIYLYLTAAKALIVPKDCTRNSLNDIEDLLKTTLDSKVYHISKPLYEKA